MEQVNGQMVNGHPSENGEINIAQNGLLDEKSEFKGNCLASDRIEVNVNDGGVIFEKVKKSEQNDITNEDGHNNKQINGSPNVIPYILPKVYDEDEIDGWKNNATDIYKEKYDEQTFEQVSKSQFKDAGARPSGIMDKLKKVSMGLFTKIGPISMDSSPEWPRSAGGVGFATVVNHVKFPLHDFFRPGRCFRLRIRHANLSFRDDTRLDVRVACIKFADEDQGGPLDLILFTGRVAPYHSAKTFEEFLEDFKHGDEGLKRWVFKQPSNLHGRIDGVRRNPKSYYDQRYFSHVIYEFTGQDKMKRYARIRLIPADGSEETGLLDEEQQKSVWNTSRRPDESLHNHYLHEEYVERLMAGPLQYRLQIQVRSHKKGEVMEGTNPCLLWDSSIYPWQDLAIFTVALPLSEEVISKSRFSLNNHPPSFRLPEMTSADDFGSLGHAMAGIHGHLEKGYIKDSEDVDKLFRTKYTVKVVTGKVGKAGTDADVFITLTGKLGRSKPINLDNMLHDDFEMGQTDEFKLEVTHVGELVAVDIEMKSTLLSKEWFLDYVEVTDEVEQVSSKFPCYQWLTQDKSKVFLRNAEALLIHQELSPFSYLQRRYELEERRELYKWERVKFLPSRMKAESYEDLPKSAKFHQDKETDLKGKYLRTLANTGVGAIKSMFKTWDIFNDYMTLLTNVLKDKKTIKKVAKVWKNDEEFGRQFLNGVNPTRIQRCTKLPPDFPVTNDMVQKFLDRELSLEEEMAAGHVYIASYPELQRLQLENNTQPNVKHFLVAPICLLYVNSSDNLVPIAIQLRQVGMKTHDEENPIWTPADDENEWLYVKMWVREADAQVHQIISRHLLTHLVMEAVCVATMRNLPSVHPVFKLLIPHLRYTIAVNVLGRQSLYPAEDGLFDKYLAIGRRHEDLLQAAYKRFKWVHLNVPKKLEQRDVVDREKLPNYHYRDDALALWKVVKKYIRTVIMIYYWTNENICKDEELQKWIHDLATEGFPVYGTLHNLPQSFETIESVVEFLTEILFTATCQNSALTGGMMDYYAFCPNAPTMLNEPPPKSKGGITMNTIMKALPSRQKTAEIIAACYTLSRFSKDELFLGQCQDNHFQGELVESAILAFQEDLKNVSAQIKERNKDLEFPYTYLLPEKIANSISN